MGKCGCTGVFEGVLVTEARSPCFSRYDLVLQDFTSVREFKSHIHELTQVPPARQKLLGLVKGTILQNDADWAAMVEEAPAQQSVAWAQCKKYK